MLKGEVIRIRGWGRDSDRIGLVIYWWAVGLGHSLWLSCLFDVWFDWQGIKVVGWAMIDFNRRSEMEVCDRSRFELCHLTRIHVVRLSRILVGGWLPEYWLVLMGLVVKLSMTPGWVKSRFLNGICGDRDDRKLKLEMWVIVVWIKGNHILVEDHYRLVVYSVGWCVDSPSHWDSQSQEITRGDDELPSSASAYVMTVLIGFEIVEWHHPWD